MRAPSRRRHAKRQNGAPLYSQVGPLTLGLWAARSVRPYSGDDVLGDLGLTPTCVRARLPARRRRRAEQRPSSDASCWELQPLGATGTYKLPRARLRTWPLPQICSLDFRIVTSYNCHANYLLRSWRWLVIKKSSGKKQQQRFSHKKYVSINK